MCLCMAINRRAKQCDEATIAGRPGGEEVCKCEDGSMSESACKCVSVCVCV